MRRILRRTLNGFGENELMTRAAALAFYAALSFAPLLVLLLWIVSSLQPAWQQQMLGHLRAAVGTRAAAAVQLVLDNARSRPGFGRMAGLVSLAITLFSASAVFTQLQQAINRIWGLRPRPGRAWLDWVRARLRALGLLLALVFLLVVSFAAGTLISLFLHGDTLLWHAVDAVAALALFTALFASIFKVLPDAVIAWRDALAGALATAAMFALGKFAIGVYLDASRVGGAYGPASSVVVLLVWVYYAGMIVLVGAEMTRAIAGERQRPIRPRPYAETLRPERVDDVPPPAVDEVDGPHTKRNVG